MHVISASRRTDIPAFYAPWFMNRVRAGTCHWQNPFSRQVYRVSLAPEDVQAVVFWTRSPRPLLRHLDELDARGYRYAFHVTITGYGPPLETHNPHPDGVIAALRALSARIGPARVIWRYDPIVISSVTPPAYHAERFARIAAQVSGTVERVIFSFVDLYGKTQRNLDAITRSDGVTFRAPDSNERRDLVRRLRDAADQHGMTLQACCEADADHVAGVRAGGCIDRALIAAMTGTSNPAPPAAPTRAHCQCVKATDIGAYDTCLFGCRYCYATNRRATAQAHHAAHDPADTILFRPPALRGLDLDALVGSANASQRPEIQPELL